MEFVRCILCKGELVFTNHEKAVFKKVKCLDCGFCNSNQTKKQAPEVIVIRKTNHD
jgi:hypothetical protein